MPFGLLWCCYAVMQSMVPIHGKRHQCLSACCGVVTSTPKREAALLSAGHQCLSACCGVVTSGSEWGSPRRPGVTNAFRPVVVLLLGVPTKEQRHWIGCHQCLSACCGVVTRRAAWTLDRQAWSPMPFGLLWCCYGSKSLVRLAPLGRHQCLSACCGVVTAGPFYARIERVQRTKRMGALFVLFPRHVEEGLMHRNSRKTGRNDRDGTPPILIHFWSGPEFDGPVFRDHTR